MFCFYNHFRAGANLDFGIIEAKQPAGLNRIASLLDAPIISRRDKRGIGPKEYFLIVLKDDFAYR